MTRTLFTLVPPPRQSLPSSLPGRQRRPPHSTAYEADLDLRRFQASFTRYSPDSSLPPSLSSLRQGPCLPACLPALPPACGLSYRP